MKRKKLNSKNPKYQKKMKTLLKFVKNLLKKLRELKSIKPILSRINLLIIRDTFSEKSTLGKLFINGESFCDTLELPYINNERSISCIPAGRYKVRLRLARESATREYLHLLIQDVPNRDYILFHRGNTTKDTKGCVLVGQSREQDRVNNSRLAMDLVIKEIINLGGENINLIIKNR